MLLYYAYDGFTGRFIELFRPSDRLKHLFLRIGMNKYLLASLQFVSIHNLCSFPFSFITICNTRSTYLTFFDVYLFILGTSFVAEMQQILVTLATGCFWMAATALKLQENSVPTNFVSKHRHMQHMNGIRRPSEIRSLIACEFNLYILKCLLINDRCNMIIDICLIARCFQKEISD